MTLVEFLLFFICLVSLLIFVIAAGNVFRINFLQNYIEREFNRYEKVEKEINKIKETLQVNSLFKINK